MSLQILGGVAKNFSLIASQGLGTRPTSALLKRRLFDSIQHFEDKTFVDLCSGTGSIGLEALSRGAEEVFLVENSKLALKCLLKNAQKMTEKFSQLKKVHVYDGSFQKWMESYRGVSCDIVLFFDPPYEQVHLYEEFFEALKAFKKLQGIQTKVIVEACRKKTMGLDEFEQKFGTTTKVLKQGSSYFAIYDF